MNFYSLLIIYILFQMWFIVLFRFYKISLYSSFYIVYTILIGVPFFIIFAEIKEVFYISEITHRAINAHTTLPMGDGVKPISYLLVFNFIYLLIGTLFLEKIQSVKVKINTISDEAISNYYLTIKIIFSISVIYVFLRYLYYPDFPLFVILQEHYLNMPIRDIAYVYGSNTNTSYIFLPSINSQFYRVLMPLSFFMLLFYYKNYNKDKKILFFLITIATVVITLNIGTFKRTPILYLISWLIIYLYMFKLSTRLIIKVFISTIVLVGLLTLITFFYDNGNNGKYYFIYNILSRLAVGEAKGEFLAIEHFGLTFDYMYFDIFTVYFQKVLGFEVKTFSELWKILVGGSRGYTSIGIVAEFIVSFGLLSLFYFILFIMSILYIDKIFKMYSNSIYKPVIAGLIVFISFMSVKGFFSQLFTGGTITLISVAIIINLITKYNGFKLSIKKQ